MSVDPIAALESSWITDAYGKEGGAIALMTAVHVMRNIKGHPFVNKCDRSQLYDIAAHVLRSVGMADAWQPSDFRQIDAMDSISKGMLIEARMITPEMARGGAGRFIIRTDDGAAVCTINEEDHICVKVSAPGLDLDAVSERASALISPIEADAADDPVLGHLTARPSHVGTGMKIFVLLHLPALDVSGDSGRVISAMERDWSRVTVEKLTSDNHNTLGSFYVISNRVTLGISVREMVDLLVDASKSLIAKEMFARHKLAHARNSDLADRFWRAWGLIRYARKTSFSEAVNRISFIKLGSDIGILPEIREDEWLRAIISSQSAHLAAINGSGIAPVDEPYIRASLYRRFIELASSEHPRQNTLQIKPQ